MSCNLVVVDRRRRLNMVPQTLLLQFLLPPKFLQLYESTVIIIFIYGMLFCFLFLFYSFLVCWLASEWHRALSQVVIFHEMSHRDPLSIQVRDQLPSFYYFIFTTDFYFELCVF